MNHRGLASGLLAAVVALLLAIPREAGAALIAIQSLESLAFEATTVVYATRLSTVDAGDYAVASTYRVEKGYVGELHAGDTFTVDDSAYPASDPFGQTTIADEGKRVFFLERRGAEGESWSIVSTGARLVAAGRVYRFFQYMNPGGLAPAPEGEGRDPGPIAFAAFERKLGVALSRAERGHALLSRKCEREAARRACLELLGPPVLPRDADPDGDSLIGRAMMRAFAEGKDVEGAIEVLARTQQTFVTGFPLVAVKDALPRALAMARDAARPIAVRVAAIEALESFTAFDERYDPTPLVPLLADRSPDVRVAAVHAIASQAGRTPPRPGQPDKSRRILRDDWKKEKDTWVKLALAKALEWLAKPDSVLPPADPLFAARRGRGSRLELEYFAAEAMGTPGILPPEVRYAATDARGVTREGDLGNDGFSYGMASGEARLDLGLEPGVYDVRVAARFDFHGTKVERTARIEEFMVSPPSAVDAPVESSVEPAPADEPRAAGSAGAAPERAPRGCGGCTAADPKAALSAFLVPLAALALVMRRRNGTKTP